MNIETIIEEQYKKLTICKSDYERLNIYSSIIQLRKISKEERIKNRIYSDIKNYLKYSILAVEETAFEYYELNEKQIKQILEPLPLVEQLSLLRYFERDLRYNGYLEKINWLKNITKKKKILYLKENLSVQNFCKLIIELTTYNVYSIIVTIFLFFIFYTILLLPAPIKNMVLFKSVFQAYNTNNFTNHVMNSLVSFSTIESDFKLNPVTIMGVFIEILIKLFLFIVIINYLVEELKSKIKI